jgi:hypothetical protein
VPFNLIVGGCSAMMISLIIPLSNDITLSRTQIATTTTATYWRSDRS